MNRNLRFGNLEDVEKELKKLENSQVEASGFLTYYQILNHSADHIYFSMMGFPGRNWPFFVRKTYGKYKLSQIMEEGYIQPDSPLPYAPKDSENGNEASAMDKLKNAIVDFSSYEGSLCVHPFYDTLTKELWEKLHSMYIANLLGFVNIGEKKVEIKTPEIKAVEPSKVKIEEPKPKISKQPEPVLIKEKKTLKGVGESKPISKKKTVPLQPDVIVAKKTINKKTVTPISKKEPVIAKKKATKEVESPKTVAKKKPVSKKATPAPTAKKVTQPVSKKKTKETVKKKR